MPNPIGLTMPIARTTSSLGVLAFSTTEIQATYYNLKSLLLTNWGERPEHYFLGCNLIEFFFAPITAETQETIIERIQQQVANWIPYVNLDTLDVSIGQPENQAIYIKIAFSVKGRQDLNSVLEVAVTPAAGA
jgi:phage baseplate assembly protein W